VVRKEPMYIPAICLEELGETMEADNREEIWTRKLPNANE
jgi:hypothetical protein